MARVRLIHWKPAEAVDKAELLRAAGYDVDVGPVDGAAGMRALSDVLPAAFVIDLSRLPSHGRQVALALRQFRPTRSVPIVLVEGDPEKVDRLRRLLPDAVFTRWSRIRSSLRGAIARPPAEPVVPNTRPDGYSGTPLPRKLGIKAGGIVNLVDAPGDFERTLGGLPEGVVVRRTARGPADLTLWFVRSRRDYEQRIAAMAHRAAGGGLWVAWPKKASGMATDVSEAIVRATGLAAGLVDFKVCAIDATWSGLRFSRAASDGEAKRR
jgi:hypothetical protein